MVNKCAICGNSSKTGYSTFKFPKDPSIRAEWVTFVQQIKPFDAAEAMKSWVVLCEKHFTHESFYSHLRIELGYTKLKRLLSSAIPTIYALDSTHVGNKRDDCAIHQTIPTTAPLVSTRVYNKPDGCAIHQTPTNTRRRAETEFVVDSASSLPSIPKDPRSEEKDPCRLWIGNLDPQITEFQLLKVLQKFGSLEKFDYLYHKAGPDAGKPRGYCFVTYSSIKEVKNVQKHLHQKKIGSRHLIVKQAHSSQEVSKPQVTLSQPAPCTTSLSKSTQIAAIEAKLKMMQQSEDVTSFLPKTVASVSSLSSSSASSSSSVGKISKLAEVALANGMKPAKPRSHHAPQRMGRPKPYTR